MNSFPTGAGLASSASSMAALATALGAFLGPGVPAGELARWARLGSGSAVRSLSGGYVRWEPGSDPGGADCEAVTVVPAGRMPLDVLAAVVEDRPKPVGSTEAMERCRLTSPAYGEFQQRTAADVAGAIAALEAADLAALGRLAEANCLRMHEVLRLARPPIEYFLPVTRSVIDAVRRLEIGGCPCFFTVDAGPNVVVFAAPGVGETVAAALEALPGVLRVFRDRVGSEGARIEP